jgi:hypothetical protein
MNKEAVRHLDKAAGFIAKGEAFYRKAVEEIRAAQQADPTLTQRQIGKAMGRSDTWVGDILQWDDQGAPRSPWAGSGPRKAASHTRTVLREAPLEQVEQIIAALPKERQQAIAAAAGHEYLKARQEQDEAERHRTPAEVRERLEARESLTKPVRQAVGGFASLGIVGHLEQATEELRELNADASLTPQAANKIERALDAFTTEFTFARAMLGEGDGS